MLDVYYSLGCMVGELKRLKLVFEAAELCQLLSLIAPQLIRVLTVIEIKL